MRLTIDEARQLSCDVLRRYHFRDGDASIVAEHLIDAHLTGYEFAGLPRLLVVLGRFQQDPQARPGEIVTLQETPVSARLDAQGNLGYVACWHAVHRAIDKARTAGVAVVGVNNAHYSGRSGYYTDLAAREGFFAFHASHACPMVAPPGGQRPLLGSNPLTFAFPTAGDPVVVDLATASSTWGELQLAAAVGEQLPPGIAIGADGQPTTDPNEGLKGALIPWGGHKGFAMNLVVQLVGVLAGGEPIPSMYGSFGFFFVLVEPELLGPIDEFHARVESLLGSLREAGATRIPGERAAAMRRERLAEGSIEVPDEVVTRLQAAAAQPV